jgi:solute:Na+ symporter, SSS family
MPHFVSTQVPPVLTGLLVAAVFAAAMSSLDSALNSLSAALTVDFLKPASARGSPMPRG